MVTTNIRSAISTKLFVKSLPRQALYEASLTWVKIVKISGDPGIQILTKTPAAHFFHQPPPPECRENSFTAFLVANGTTSVTRLGDFRKVWVTNFLLKVAQFYGDFLCYLSWSKNCCCYFLGNLCKKNWATFYFRIWSHCAQQGEWVRERERERERNLQNSRKDTVAWKR